MPNSYPVPLQISIDCAEAESPVFPLLCRFRLPECKQAILQPRKAPTSGCAWEQCSFEVLTRSEKGAPWQEPRAARIWREVLFWPLKLKFVE